MQVTSPRNFAPGSKLISLLLLLFAVLLLLVPAATVQAQAESTGLPPLIDRELFFGDPEISGAQISPDGKFI